MGAAGGAGRGTPLAVPTIALRQRSLRCRELSGCVLRLTAPSLHPALVQPKNINNNRYALWLDAELTAGLSRTSLTFGNDSLSSEEEFRVGSVEVWWLQ